MKWILGLLVVFAPVLQAQTAFLMRVAPRITLTDQEKVVVPLELVNIGTAPLQFAVSTANEAWGLSGMEVLPGMAIRIPLRTFEVPAGLVPGPRLYLQALVFDVSLIRLEFSNLAELG